METLKDSLKAAKRMRKAYQDKIDDYIKRALAYENVKEMKEAARCYSLAVSIMRDESRQSNYIHALTFYLENKKPN